MARWKVLLACVLGWATLSCAPQMQAGLANGPRLGGAGEPAEGNTDVIADGADSCGRDGQGSPLRGSVARCPSMTEPAPARDLVPTWLTSSRPTVAATWVQHFYVGWTCRHAPSSETSPAPVAWSRATPVAALECSPR